MSPRIKICCIGSIAEAETALLAGADLLGLVSRMPSGPGVISDRDIARIANHVRGRAETVLLTSLTDPVAIAAQWRECGTSVIQLTDVLQNDVSSVVELRKLVPKAGLWQVIHVKDEKAVTESAMYAPHVDGLLLDSGNPEASTKQLGGTGRVHDWRISRRIVSENPETPVWLAGGLTPENVSAAVETARPHGLDVCSGVRTNGQLDGAKARDFVMRARGCE